MTKQDVYTTVAGCEVKLRPVSRQLIYSVMLACRREAEQRGDPLKPPTYTVETAGGGKETYEHDADSIAAPGTSEAEKAAWEKHQAALRALEEAQRERVARVLLLEGIALEGPPPEWVARMKRYGIELPEDPDDLRLVWLSMDVLRTPADMRDAVQQIMLLSMAGLSKEEIEAAEAAFRGPVPGHTAERVADTAGRLDGQPTVGGVAGSAGVGPDAAAVGPARRG